jgi:glycosyltransferase involved in cell wall biosynthesis
VKIAVISSTVFPVGCDGGQINGLANYGGLECIAWQQAKGLAEMGHQVALIAPDGSECPNVQMIHTGPARRHDEKMAYGGWEGINPDGSHRKWEGYWKLLPQFACALDHSVAGDQHLLVKIHGKSKWLTFEELYSWALGNSSGGVYIGSNGTQEVPVKGLEVPSLTSLHKIEWNEVPVVIRHKRKDNLHLVRARSGVTVKVTSGHSLMAAGQGKVVEVRADNCVGRHVAVAKSVPCSEKDTIFWPIDSPRFLKKFYISGSIVPELVEKCRKKLVKRLTKTGTKLASARSTISNWKKSVPVGQLSELPIAFDIRCPRIKGKVVKWPIRLTDSDLALMGLWIGDGCFDTRVAVKLSSGEGAKYVADSVAQEFCANCRRCSNRPDVNHQINSTLLVKLFKAAGFTGKAYTKKIPDWVFDLSSRQIGMFLRGYFSSDGHIRKRVCVSSVNEALIKQTGVLLSLCGISYRISVSTNIGGYLPTSPITMWELNVPTDQWGLFLDKVGFVQEYRNVRLREGILGRRSKRGDVPFCLLRKRKRSSSPKKEIDEEVYSLSKVANKQGVAVAEKFALSDVSWRRIKSSEVVDSPDEYVYDLSVPSAENFFVDGVCCHNSWQKWGINLKIEGKLKAPVLQWLHAPVQTMINSAPPIDKPCFVAISEDQARTCMSHVNRPAKCCYNGVNLDYYKPLGIQRSNRYLFLARFSSIKGPDLAIEACKRAGVGLDLVGDTSITNEPELLDKCKKMCDGEQIRMVGPCSRGNAVWWFSQAKALLHPNRAFQEPFGLALVESQLCHTPVIAWNNGSCREVIKDGETGFLVESLDQMVELLRTNAVDNIDRSKCRSWAERFSVEAMVKRCHELCTLAVNSGGW